MLFHVNLMSRESMNCYISHCLPVVPDYDKNTEFNECKINFKNRP